MSTFAIRNVVDQAQEAFHIEPGHLGADVVAEDRRGGRIAFRLVFRVRGIRNGRIVVAFRLIGFEVKGSRVFVEFVAAGHDFVAVGQGFYRARQVVVCSVGIIEFRLQDVPFDLHLIGFAIRPVFIVRIIRVVGDQILELDGGVVV